MIKSQNDLLNIKKAYIKKMASYRHIVIYSTKQLKQLQGSPRRACRRARKGLADEIRKNLTAA